MTANQQLQTLLDLQRAAQTKQPNPSYEERIATLNKIRDLLKNNTDIICETVSEDFGNRPHTLTKIADIGATLQAIQYIKKHLRKWMKKSKRERKMLMAPVSSWVIPKPLGVVGIIGPWNYPLLLSLVPLLDALAAGNRVMLKMSEFVPKTGQLLKRLFSEKFEQDQVAVINGDVEVAKTFSSLPFDHILATGSCLVGKAVMKAASENLTPVTLELGGKCPTIVTESANLNDAAEKINLSKLLNAGQTCVATDYILVKREQQEELIKSLLENAKKHYPNYCNNKEYTHIINERQFDRLTELNNDAKQQGANITSFSDEQDDKAAHCMVPKLLTGVNNEMKIMQEEIFGPLLPIIPYDTMDDVIKFINNKPHPLAISIFSKNNDEIEQINNQTSSGALDINMVMLHSGVDDLPFGGVGASGMGQYHGHEGFLTFSQLKPVAKYSGPSVSFLPPYNRLMNYFIDKFFT